MVCRDGCLTKTPSDALRSVLASQSVSKLSDWSAASAVDLGSYFTLGVKSDDTPVSRSVSVSAHSPAATPRPSSSRTRVSNQRMSHVSHCLSNLLYFSLLHSLYLSFLALSPLVQATYFVCSWWLRLHPLEILLGNRLRISGVVYVIFYSLNVLHDALSVVSQPVTSKCILYAWMYASKLQ